MSQSQSEQAFTQLYERYYGFVYRFVQKRIRCHEAAEDITQETFTRVYIAFGNSAERSELETRAWIFKIAFHLACDYFRKRKVAVVDIDLCEFALYAPDTLKAVLDQDEAERMLSCLKPQRREVFYLHEEGYTLSEIAMMLATSHDSVKVNMARDRRKMAQVAAAS
jgi:RNA polymerase sigma-70 factor (ECF subfamily)